MATNLDKGSLNRALLNKWDLHNSFWAYTRTINVNEYTVRKS